MTRAYDSDGQDAADALGEFRSARIEAEARTLTGGEVLRLRAAVEAAAKALRQINTKGLPYQHRRDIEAARTAIEDARPLVAKRPAPSGRLPAGESDGASKEPAGARVAG